MNLLGRSVGLDQPLFLIAGPCVVESEELQLRTAERLKAITESSASSSSSSRASTRPTDRRTRAFGGPEWTKGFRVLEKAQGRSSVFRC